MNYYSLNNNAPKTSFKDAVIKGLAPDKGLYFPDQISALPKNFFENIESYTNNEIAFELIKQFVGNEIPEDDLKAIIADVLQFDFPIVEVEKDVYSLELFHGPTMAFKDVGARFMARCLSYFNKENINHVTVLVATSGDTGGAVASGFLGVNGVDVVILYPSGKVSDIQENQLTTLGQNIRALEVHGVFDDCQAMVKKAFLDESITSKMQLTSANSINIARWLPQMFYFGFAYKQLKLKNKDCHSEPVEESQNKKLVFSIPSGNYGNICAGMMAQKLGLPIDLFVASTNANKVVTDYLETGNYEPKPSVQTISNAMDVGDPSNFIRIEKLHNNDFEVLKRNLHSYSYSDGETHAAMLHLFNNCNYAADPHGAVGYLGLKKEMEQLENAQGIFLETAHPIKFLPVLDEDIANSIEIPEQIKSVLGKEKVATEISTYDELKNFLLEE
ncbi:threonine synthase [Urechidicola vernalis]|uniref:Threonine synthase n=1 Tax=Urechidicola vernalis TaxID=3075600 RepID=A0ABU2Y287_9FLAO|nr:threonine synthase [Urechidicola sp. P050]MDT0551895.1 threonine synthase [Urechidicola sp. P050]